jgi:SAM-dependent methyltransferase
MIATLLKKTLQGIQGRHILDVGPGYGEFSRVAALQIKASEITYIDCDPDVLKWQTKACLEYGIHATFIEDIVTPEVINRLGETYDLILCQEVLEHLPHPDQVVKALAGKLSRNGRLILTVPTKLSERWLRLINPSYMRNEPFGHIQEFGRKDISHLLKHADLTVVRIIPTQPHYFVGHTWLFGTRMKVDGSTGRVNPEGWKNKVFVTVTKWSFRFFKLTGIGIWGRLLPRNYFVMAQRSENENCP